VRDDRRLKRLRLRILALLAAILVSGALMVLVISLEARGLADSIDGLGAAALLLMTAAIAMLSIVLAPAAILAAAGGYIAGVTLGTAVALCGLGLGAVVCAAIARRVGTEDGPVALGGPVENLAARVRARPMHTIIVARLVPGVPFHMLSYATGLAGVRLPTVFAATVIGFAPRCFLFAALGGSLGSLDKPQTQLALVASVVVLLGVLASARRRASRRWLDPPLLPRS